MIRSRAAYGFLLPYFLVFGLFWVGPTLQSLTLAFWDDRSGAGGWTLAHWQRLWGDPFFWSALRVTWSILLLQVPLMLVLATGLAVCLESPRLKLGRLHRFAFFAPVVVAEVAYSAVFRLLFNSDFGLVNSVLRRLQLGAPPWLDSAGWAMITLALVLTWRWTGYNALLIGAALQTVPRDIYEAAELDGAGPWKQFQRLTLPQLRPVLAFCFALSCVGTLQLFSEPFLLTGGGPGISTLTLGMYVYHQGFISFNFGYASALAYTLAAMAGGCAWLLLRERS